MKRQKSTGTTSLDDFVQVFDTAGWDHNGDHGIFETNYDIDPIGIQITVYPVGERHGMANAAIMALVKIIRDLNLFDGGGSAGSPEVPAGELQFRVGHKPRS